MQISVVLEVAPKKAFASALDWPGWSRGARTPEAALESLLAYAPRYAKVTKRADVKFTLPKSIDDFKAVEELEGGGTTEFGVPGSPAKSESSQLSGSELARLISLLQACWKAFDAAADAAESVTLSTGPRGGGRPLEKIRGHVRDAEIAYIGQLGSKIPDAKLERETFVAALHAAVKGEPLEVPRKTKNPWSPRYAVRRAAWHVLDHAWEIEDRAGTAG